MPDELLTIGQLAARTSVATSALRYYEEVGLLPESPRSSGQRRYPAETVELVGIILFLRDVGFSLQEIRELIASRDESHDAWRELVQRKVVELDDRITKATVAKTALEHAVRCRHDDLLSCPNFLDVIAARLAGRPLEDTHPRAST